MLSLQNHQLDGVIFDMDGLIVNNSQIYKQAYQIAARQLGYEITDGLYSQFLGVSHDACQQILRDAFGNEFPAKAFSLKIQTQYRETLLQTPNRFYPGFKDLLAVFQSHQLPLGLATSSSLARVALNFSGTPYRSAFNAIVTSDDIVQSKPHPEIYLKTLQKLGVSPQVTLILEDSNQGMRAAIASGGLAVMIPSIAPPADDVQKSLFDSGKPLPAPSLTAR